MYLKYCWLEGQPNANHEITIRPALQENSTVQNETLHKIIFKITHPLTS